MVFLKSSEPTSTWTQSIDVVCERSSKCDIISVLIKFEQPINNKELEIKKMSTESRFSNVLIGLKSIKKFTAKSYLCKTHMNTDSTEQNVNPTFRPDL